MVTRRDFAARAAGIAAGASLSLPAASWARGSGADDRVHLGAIGVGSRGRDVLGHLSARASLLARQAYLENKRMNLG